MNSLTDRERQLAILVAQGLSDKEIAQQLCLSRFTVRNQVKNMINKLGLKNRTQFAFLLGSIRILMS